MDIVTEYAEPEGTVYVKILASVEDTHHDSQVGGQVTKYWPTLRITTYTGERNDQPGYVTLRSRKYSIDIAERWEDYGNTHSRWQWDTRSYHMENFRNESGSGVDYKSPVSPKLRELAKRVRDRFVAEHPEWERTSHRLRLEWQVRHAEERAADRRREAERYDEQAATLRAELAGYAEEGKQ